MNNYPEWWNQTVTVFNRYEDQEGRIFWYRHTMYGCFWKDTENLLVSGETAVYTNATICRVPVNTKFREKYVWDNLQDAEKRKFFTFGTGDILVRGKVLDTPNEYVTGNRSSDLLNKYKKLQGCFVVEKCSVNTGKGRGSEHYYVRGV